MRNVLRLALLLSPFFACSDPAAVKSATGNIQLPPAVSADAVAKLIRTHHYTVNQVGFTSTWFGKDTTTWEGSMEDTSQFFRKHLADYRSLRFEFGTDSTMRMVQKDQIIQGSWKLTTDSASLPQLHLTYLSKEFNFGNDTTPQRVTQTYLLRGADEQALLLETPFKLNSQKVSLLMYRK